MIAGIIEKGGLKEAPCLVETALPYRLKACSML